MRLSWSFEEVDTRLKQIMINICEQISDACEQYGFRNNFVIGANIAGFSKVANAMLSEGVI